MRKTLDLPNLDYLKNKFSYNEHTGILYRKETFKHRKAGDTVGHKRYDGYVTTYIQGKVYYVHRLAWYICTGSYNKNVVVDHINGITSDNRLCNLREISHSRNILKGKKAKNNTSGYKNIHFRKRDKKYQVYIEVNKKRIFIGVYKTLDEAIKARDDARLKLIGDFKVEIPTI